MNTSFKLLFVSICLFLLNACCIEDRVTSSSLSKDDIDYLIFSPDLAVEQDYYYSKIDDTITIRFLKSELARDDRRNGAESCKVMEFDVLTEGADNRKGVRLDFEMASRSENRARAEFVFRDFSNEVFTTFIFLGCNPDGTFNIENCQESVTVNGAVFNDVIVFINNRSSGNDPVYNAVLNRNGLLYA